jgi:ubiquinone/menaquinone biosynthesis C-methylase UbiE
MALSRSQVRTFYDRFGAKQDRQAFYEDPGLHRLIAHASFETASTVLEFGCGTGRFAEQLLRDRLPATATFAGIDLSPVMVALARSRLASFGPRAIVHQTDGSIRLPVADGSVDRVISVYVLDLLSDDDIRRFLAEAHRALRSAGRLCLASLTAGFGVLPRLVSGAWTLAYRLRPSLVGGCRPLRLAPHLDRARWTIRHRETLAPFGVPSEILVTSPVTPSAPR